MDIVIQLISVVGGFELIKWLVRSIIYRKQEKQKQEVEIKKQELEVKKEEFSICTLDSEEDRKKIAFLEDRIRERDKKIDDVYILLRTEEKDHLETIRELYETKLKLQEAELKRCDVRGCSSRKPPSEY